MFTKAIVVATLSLGLGMGLLSTVPQEFSEAGSSPAANSTSPLDETSATDPRSILRGLVTGQQGEAGLQRRVDLAFQQLKEARENGSVDDREAATKELEEALAADYEVRLDGYEQYLADLEAKLVTMKKQLERRRAAKPEMIKLRMKVLEAEADDLGWPKNIRNNHFEPRRGSMNGMR